MILFHLSLHLFTISEGLHVITVSTLQLHLLQVSATWHWLSLCVFCSEEYEIIRDRMNECLCCKITVSSLINCDLLVLTDIAFGTILESYENKRGS